MKIKRFKLAQSKQMYHDCVDSEHILYGLYLNMEYQVRKRGGIRGIGDRVICEVWDELQLGEILAEIPMLPIISGAGVDA